MRSNKRKKLDYNPKKYSSNPFFRNKKRRKGRQSISLKGRLITSPITVFCIFFIGVLTWLTLISNFFQIKTISINATGNVGAEEVRAKVNEQLSGVKYKYLKNSNIFIFDNKKFADSLNQYYNFDYLSIKKSYPSKINITFKTRQQAFIWQEAGILYYIDSKGNIINETSPADQNLKNFFLVENQSMQNLVDKKIDNISDILNFITEINKQFLAKKINSIKIEKFILDNNFHAVKLKALNGPAILFNVNGDAGDQTDKLNVLIKEKLKGDFSKKQYIDIRFGDMIYYQ